MSVSKTRAAGALRWVAACLLLSGAGSLVLEIVWSRLLKLVFGSTTLAISTILVAYMLGLGIGGLLGGRWATRLRNGIRAYGLVEVAIGLYAFAVPFILDAYPWLNREVLGPLSFWPAAFVRFTLALVVLLLPTVLMGATLPILVAALVRRSDEIARRVGLLYGMNTLGAVTGVVVASFVLFPWVGVRMTNTIGAGLDLAVGLFVLVVLPRWLPAARRDEPPTAAQPSAELSGARRWSPALLSYGAVGFTALVYEVAWTRALTSVFGSSVYAFASMLAAFLIGIALGSLLGRRWFDRLRRPLPAYAAGLAILGVASLATIYLLHSMPSLFITVVGVFGLSGTTLVVTNVLISLVAMIGPTLVLGALFPLVVRAVDQERRSCPSTVGDVYFVNTVGSASGAFAAGFLLIPGIGLRWTMLGAVAVNLLTALAVLAWQPQWRGRARQAVLALGSLVLVLLLAFPPSWDLTQAGPGVFYTPEYYVDIGTRTSPIPGVAGDRRLYYEEGINTTVSVHAQEGNVYLNVNGKTDASLMDMSTQVLSGHIPLMLDRPRETVLVIGYASGVTAGAVTLYGPSRLDVAEIEPAIVEASHYFDDFNHRPLEQDCTRLILDDGRTLLSRGQKTYDVIISEPSNPWISGCSNLFTREFFDLARDSLEPGGRLLQWIQLYEMNPEGLRSVFAAIGEVFPHVYGFHASSADPDLLLIATMQPIELRELTPWEDLPEAVRGDLERVGNTSTADLWSLLQLSDADIRRLASEATHRNTDDSMFVELQAPWHLYETPESNLRLIGAGSRGILPLLEGAEAGSVDAELLGEIAHSYWTRRENPLLADELIQRAYLMGRSSSALAAQSVFLRDREEITGDELLRRLDLAVDNKPRAFLPRLVRAEELYSRGRLDEALSDIDAALSVRPRHPFAQRLRVYINAAAGRVGPALEDGRALLGRSYVEFVPKIIAEHATLSAAAGRMESARRDMWRYLSLRPYSPREWQILAAIERRLGNEAAAARAERNIEIVRANSAIYRHREALRLIMQERIGEAVDMLEGLRESHPDYAPAAAELERLRATM